MTSVEVSLDQEFLDKTDFNSLASVLDKKINNWRQSFSELQYLQDQNEDNPDPESLSHFGKVMQSLKSASIEISHIIEALEEKAETDRQERLIDVVLSRYENDVEEFREFQRGAATLTAFVERRKTTLIASFTPVRTPKQTFDNVSQMQAYDQDLEVRQRQEKIDKIEREAEVINALSGDVEKEIIKQGETVDKIAKNVKVAEKNVEEGVEDLKETRDMQKKGNRCGCIWIIVIAVLVAVAVTVVLIYLFGIPKPAATVMEQGSAANTSRRLMNRRIH